jgi:hypothetical protein
MDALDRLYRRMVESLAHAPREAGGVPVTIGEVYQTLVPYRAVRADLGFTELAAYEHALLRLLAGERGYVRVDAVDVLEELQRELAAPNPILGVYRDYSDAAAHVNPNIAVRIDVPSPPPPAASAASPAGERAPRRAGAKPPPSMDATSPRQAAPAATPQAPPAPACPGCRSTLPKDGDVRFCPFCGKCLKPVPCAECSAMVEPEWSFCANCGWPRQTAPAPAPKPEQRLR